MAKQDEKKDETKNGTNTRDTPKSNRPATAWWFIFGLAVLVLMAYAYFIVFMVNKTSLGEGQELQWSRLVFLFSGVEAIVFAAVGFVFGREVHRSKAEAADTRAQNAENKTQEAQKKAGEIEGKMQIIRKMAKSKINKKNGATDYLARIQPGTEAMELQNMLKIIDDLFPDNEQNR
ncbi:MAG: hypothetical protein AAF765_16205 [Bacteroidota bacterium]